MERARPLIFFRKGCAKSDKALEYLTSRAVGVDAVKVKENEGSLHQLEKATGQTRMPAMVYGGEHIHDFGIAELAGFLQKYQLDQKTGR